MRSAFTLLEVLLVIALLVALAGMTLPLFGNAAARHQLAESAERLRSLMYMAGSEAKLEGRRLELVFADPLDENYLAAYATTAAPVGKAYRKASVQVERNPLQTPGTFDPLYVDWAKWSSLAPTVQIARIDLSEPLPAAGDDLSKSMGSQGGADGADSGTTVLFGPDGRSQVGDVTITLVNDRLDGYLVQLRGATGLATIKPMPAIKKDQ